jgi:hypothetical protein
MQIICLATLAQNLADGHSEKYSVHKRTTQNTCLEHPKVISEVNENDIKSTDTVLDSEFLCAE